MASVHNLSLRGTGDVVCKTSDMGPDDLLLSSHPVRLMLLRYLDAA